MKTYLHVSHLQMFPNIGGDNVPQLVQVVLLREVGQVSVTPRNVLVYAMQVQTK